MEHTIEQTQQDISFILNEIYTGDLDLEDERTKEILTRLDDFADVSPDEVSDY